MKIRGDAASTICHSGNFYEKIAIVPPPQTYNHNQES